MSNSVLERVILEQKEPLQCMPLQASERPGQMEMIVGQAFHNHVRPTDKSFLDALEYSILVFRD